MKLARKKICLIFCGGTTISYKYPEDTTVFEKKDISKWLKLVPELELIAEIEPVFLFGGESSEITPLLWLELADEIKKRISSCDGFVVIHGIDNILFTSSMISYILQNLSKPVVFTGSQISSQTSTNFFEGLENIFKKYSGLGVKANLINAVQVATMDLAEVCLMFGNRLIRANKAFKTDDLNLNIFDSADSGLIGKVDFGITLLSGCKKRQEKKLNYSPQIDTDILATEIYPGFDYELLKNMVQGKRGLFIINRSSTTPNFVVDICHKILKRDQSVILFSPNYQIDKSDNYPLINLRGITFEAAITKFMWVLGQTRDLKEIKKMMLNSLAGEF